MLSVQSGVLSGALSVQGGVLSGILTAKWCAKCGKRCAKCVKAVCYVRIVCKVVY
jgi:hypothetical protein